METILTAFDVELKEEDTFVKSIDFTFPFSKLSGESIKAKEEIVFFMNSQLKNLFKEKYKSCSLLQERVDPHNIYIMTDKENAYLFLSFSELTNYFEANKVKFLEEVKNKDIKKYWMNSKTFENIFPIYCSFFQDCMPDYKTLMKWNTKTNRVDLFTRNREQNTLVYFKNEIDFNLEKLKKAFFSFHYPFNVNSFTQKPLSKLNLEIINQATHIYTEFYDYDIHTDFINISHTIDMKLNLEIETDEGFEIDKNGKAYRIYSLMDKNIKKGGKLTIKYDIKDKILMASYADNPHCFIYEGYVFNKALYDCAELELIEKSTKKKKSDPNFEYIMNRPALPDFSLLYNNTQIEFGFTLQQEAYDKFLITFFKDNFSEYLFNIKLNNLRKSMVSHIGRRYLEEFEIFLEVLKVKFASHNCDGFYIKIEENHNYTVIPELL